MFFLGLFSTILGKGLIRFLVMLYCLCLLYIILYVILTLFSWVYYFIFQEQDQQTNMYSFYVYRIRSILFQIATWIFYICLYIVGKLTGIFLTLYLVYFAARLIGLHILLLLFFKVFRDCKELGLFDFFDNLVGVIFGFDSFGKKIASVFFATFDFTKTFMEETLGIVIPGYDWNLDFFKELGSILENVGTEDVSNKVIALLMERKPIIKINYVEPTKKTDLQAVKISNCQAIVDKIQLPPDADTVETLRFHFEKAMAKQKCEIDIMNDGPIEQLENTFVDSAKYIIDGTKKNMDVFASSLSIDLI